jgi:hypothetical protein
MIRLHHHQHHASVELMRRFFSFHNYNIKNFSLLATEVCRECEVCALVNPGKPAHISQNHISSDFPWSHVQMDLCGPLPTDDRGCHYILTLIDVLISIIFSKDYHLVFMMLVISFPKL